MGGGGGGGEEREELGCGISASGIERVDPIECAIADGLAGSAEEEEEGL